MTRGLLAIVFLILAGGMFFFYTKPTYDDVKTYQMQVAQYNQALDKATELQALKQQLLTRYNSFNPNDIVRLQKLLPDHVDNIALILDLSNLAAQHGMVLENVDVTATGQAASQSATTATIGSDEQKYESLTLKFVTYGTYESFDRFLQDLEASLRVVDLVGLSIATKDGGAGAGAKTGRIYQYDITIKTYWLK